MEYSEEKQKLQPDDNDDTVQYQMAEALDKLMTDLWGEHPEKNKRLQELFEKQGNDDYPEDDEDE